MSLSLNLNKLTLSSSKLPASNECENKKMDKYFTQCELESELERNEKAFKKEQWKNSIHGLAMSGNLDELKKIITLQNKDGKDSKGHTPLHYAVTCGQLHVIKYLVEELNADIDPYFFCKNYKLETIIYTPLYYAQMKKHFEIEKYLIEKGAKNDYGWIFYHEFPLNASVINDQIEGLRFLIKKQGLEWFKAEIKRIRNGNGENVMHFSARNTGNHRLEIVDLLVQHGGQIDIKCHENGDTPLHIAVKKFNIKLVEHICTKYKNAALNSINNYAQSPLFCVPANSTIFDDPNELASTLSPIIYEKRAVDKNDLQIQIKLLDALLIAGFDFNQKDYQGNTLLHKAAICNDLKLLSYLIENAHKYKLKINLANNFREDYANLISESFKGKPKDSKDVRDAIFVFARRGHLRGLQALTTNQNVNGINSKGYSALHYAVLCGSFEIVQYLLDKRNACTDLVAKSTSLKRDVTPLDIAIHCEEKNNGQPILENYVKIREILIAKGAKKAEDIKNSLPQSAIL